MKYHCSLEDMLADGFTRKSAQFYLNILETENNNPVFEPEYVRWAHERGFSAECASVLNLTEETCGNYLSQYDFYKVWPLNNWARLWVNDKLTLKYTLSEKNLKRYLPKYYYYTTQHGLRSLMDNLSGDQSEQGFLDCLRQVGTFACKPNNGSLAEGFFKLSWEQGRYFQNAGSVTEEEIIQFVKTHPNYIFTEYLTPSDDWVQYSPLIHTIRIMVLNEHGDDPRFVGNYIRIPHHGSGASNYVTHDGTNNEEYNIYALIDMETGAYGNGMAVYPNCAKPLDVHPDTGAPLCGTIDRIDELKQVSLDIAKWFNTLEYFGIDFGITPQGIKIMEINTHPMIMISQIKHPLYLDEQSKRYFEKKLLAIAAMSEEDKKARNRIMR